VNIRALLRQPVLTLAFYAGEARWTLGQPGHLSAAGRVPLPAGLLSDGVLLDPALAGRLLREAPDFPGHARMQVLVALPAHRSVLRQLSVPPLRGKLLDQLIEREIRRELPVLAEGAHVAWQITARGEKRAEVFVVAVARDVLESHLVTLREAGLPPLAFDLAIIAAARATGEGDCVVATVDEHEAELAIFLRGVPVIVRCVSLVEPAGRPEGAAQLAEEVERTLKFFRDSHKDDPLPADAPIALLGSAAHSAALAGRIAEVTGRAAAPPPLLLAVTPPQEAAAFAVNAGLALKELAA
jgi:Tfp pilus assembly PilM family ATPase